MYVTICSVLMQAKVSNQSWGANSKCWGTGEGTAPDRLQRGASNKVCNRMLEILYTVLLNYCQPQRRICRKFYQWKFRNETSFRLKSLWAEFFMTAKSCMQTVWKVHAEMLVHWIRSIWWAMGTSSDGFLLHLYRKLGMIQWLGHPCRLWALFLAAGANFSCLFCSRSSWRARAHSLKT